jgi:hypothetical protein
MFQHPLELEALADERARRLRSDGRSAASHGAPIAADPAALRRGVGRALIALGEALGGRDSGREGLRRAPHGAAQVGLG